MAEILVLTIKTTGGDFRINAEATIENGMFDIADDWSSGDVIAAARKNVKAEHSMIGMDGGLVLVVGGVTGFTCTHEPDRRDRL